MPLRLTSTTIATTSAVSSLFITVNHHFFSTIAAGTTNLSKLPKPFSRIPWKHRLQVIKEAQKQLADYLHATRSIPFPYADHIANNCPHSLSSVVAEVPFSPSTFPKSFQRFLRYHPINEVDFFFESIGLNSTKKNEVPRSPLPVNTLFLSDWRQFNAACALAGFGFPWVKLGLLYKEDCLIFDIEPLWLNRRLSGMKDNYGFSSVDVIGICLAFPRVLYGDICGLLDDLKIIFVDYGLASCVEGDVDAMFEVCRKIRVFYDLGCEMGKVGELMGINKSIFVEYPEEVLVAKIEYFCRLDVRKDDIGLLLLSRPEVFSFDLEERVISVSGFMKHFGLKATELESLEKKYPHVFGRNKIANLPHVMRSMDLGQWFFERMSSGDHSLLRTYSIGSPDEDLDKDYTDNLMKIQATRTHFHTFGKLSFLHGIGFGENKFTVKALSKLNSSSSQLQQRFDFLLHYGIEFSKVCGMLRLSAKILNQQERFLEEKLDFLCHDIGSSLQYLDVFPGYLCYHLERRIKPRYNFHKWLVEQGLCKKEYSISSIIATSEKQFIARLSRIHPAASKMWLESSLNKDGGASFEELSVS
ncbi:transcription termination factor MTEF18, mitochondrial [Olea europaea var. sylvestris]|uniref:Transcription termination factor MTEF18, mitochondrial n=1 Tax=Olea europaea subsp. europaea TaxID=158383 RepID=A0A8S0RYF0_OLEEU|nr:transcription termination factor MTEF18, mitochondrial [Olea europaea var. sylvestris]CAA2984602.1 transcription termination factor MTEF18, mitochondrial [Olea europaea subsp. europaea]